MKFKLFVVSILIFNSCYSMEQDPKSLSHENAQLRNENAQLQEIIR
ncbi:MAG: hypothetical protein Q8Q60_01125 [Candidatus Chromulinivorax sp.]|nr:hypothetical protein [Candidatus Chromulinivorax sp.]